MNFPNDQLSSFPTTIIIQPCIINSNSKSNKKVFRLGWLSFILGLCACLIHFISLNYLANFSPINAGIISGFFLIIAGLSTITAAYKEKSYNCFLHAQIWSCIACIILAPGLIIVSITALIVDSQEIHPICQATLPFSRYFSFHLNSDIYSSNTPCREITNLFHLTQVLNTIQLIIGFICLITHVILLSKQANIMKQIKNDTNNQSSKVVVYADPNILYRNNITCHDDNPPKYEDLPPTQASCE